MILRGNIPGMNQPHRFPKTRVYMESKHFIGFVHCDLNQAHFRGPAVEVEVLLQLVRNANGMIEIHRKVPVGQRTEHKTVVLGWRSRWGSIRWLRRIRRRGSLWRWSRLRLVLIGRLDGLRGVWVCCPRRQG